MLMVKTKGGLQHLGSQRGLPKMKNYTWKDMNKKENLRVIQNVIQSGKKLVDPIKEVKSEKEMERNVKKVIVKRGSVVILTGCGHLKFFRKIFRSAEFPFG